MTVRMTVDPFARTSLLSFIFNLPTNWQKVSLVSNTGFKPYSPMGQGEWSIQHVENHSISSLTSLPRDIGTWRSGPHIWIGLDKLKDMVRWSTSRLQPSDRPFLVYWYAIGLLQKVKRYPVTSLWFFGTRYFWNSRWHHWQSCWKKRRFRPHTRTTSVNLSSLDFHTQCARQMACILLITTWSWWRK